MIKQSKLFIIAAFNHLELIHFHNYKHMVLFTFQPISKKIMILSILNHS